VTTKEHGTGLGLAIVKKTLLEHGGDVVLDPARSPLGGARFVLTLPVPATPSP
jgi:nitrogen fixation/metabolism regulation signal transduction histidine kinase